METVFISKILKVGTSHGIILPREILNGYKWQRGDYVIFGFAGPDQLYIKRLTDIDMQKIKPQNIIS